MIIIVIIWYLIGKFYVNKLLNQNQVCFEQRKNFNGFLILYQWGIGLSIVIELLELIILANWSESS